MLEVPAARDIVLRHAARRPAAVAPLASALGRVLAADVAADRDSPPFTKSMMDGYAVRAADAAAGAALRVVGEVAAGAVPANPVGPGEAVRVFTGAPMPPGADAVLMQEHAEVVADGVRVARGVAAGANVLPRGREMAAGETVLPAGTVITPAAVGLLAAVGRAEVPVYPAARVAVLATGNELVDPPAEPGPGRIRNSNGPMLCALAARAGCPARSLGIARDDPAELAAKLADGLTADVLLVAGGVSVGDYDLVPKALAELGVETHFHSVRMKPGKPLLFGTKGETLVFGLPGNPVSSFVGFELFVRPALAALAGATDPGPRVEQRSLGEAFAVRGDRPVFHPGKLLPDNAVKPLPWFGSADLRGLLAADALLALPAGDAKFPAGSAVEVIVL